MRKSVLISINDVLAKIETGNYSGQDVKGLYVDLRDYASKSSITCEIGDFIAHPELKDRGLSHRKIKEEYEILMTGSDWQSGKQPNVNQFLHKEKPAFTQGNIIEDLASSILRADSALSKFIPVLNKQTDGITLSVLSILQDARIKIGDLMFDAHVEVHDTIFLAVNYPIAVNAVSGKRAWVDATSAIISTNIVRRGIKQGRMTSSFQVQVLSGTWQIVPR